ncbi:MAG: four helix bundle protein [Gemmatimonadota bacterium]
MGTVKRFEDLEVWQRSLRLAVKIDECCSNGALARNFGLKDQMRRAAVSIMSNIAEGFERRSVASFRYFLRVAKGSAAELRAQIYLCTERGYLEQPLADNLIIESEIISRLLAALLRYLETRSTAKQ